MTRNGRGRQGCIGASPAAELEPEHNRRCCPALELFCITMADVRTLSTQTIPTRADTVSPGRTCSHLFNADFERKSYVATGRGGIPAIRRTDIEHGLAGIFELQADAHTAVVPP